MGKKNLWLCHVIILIGVLSICIMILSSNRASKISVQEAEELLLEHLIDLNRWEPDYVIEPLDLIAREIGNEHGYRFEIRFKDTIEQVGGRVINNYVVTDDGDKIFWYDSANDELVEEK